MKAHFVHFLSPGTFVEEQTSKPIESWDVEAAVKMARDIHERHGAVPYGFRFSTRERGAEDLDSKETARSATYYLGGEVRTLAEVEAAALPSERILRDNMRINQWDLVVTNRNSWSWTQPLLPGDVVLDVELCAE